MAFRELLSLMTSLMLVGLSVVGCGRRRALRRLAVPTFTTRPLAATPTPEPFIAMPSPPGEAPAWYWSYQQLPEITEAERRTYCQKTPQEWEEYYQEKRGEAQQLSEKLEEYVLAWYHGGASSNIPGGLLPPSIDNEKTRDWTLLKPGEVNPEEQWGFVPARQEPAVDNFRALYQNNAATHVTYLKSIFVAPFDSQLLVEGDFPHARFMDYQIMEPFDPEFPVTGNMGQMEVPIVDVDIAPDPGHVNPFRIGADRDAENRHYHLVFDLKAGNSVDLNPVLQHSHFRAPGNRRVGGPFGSSGPYGDGVIVPSVLWLRYYAPDHGLEPLAGVPLPKVLLRLKTGEEFWIQPDFSLVLERATTTVSGQKTPSQEPLGFLGPSQGWFKIFGLWLIRAEARGYHRWARPYGPLPTSLVKERIRETLECYLGRGPHMPPPGNIAHSATDCPYNSYLTRVLQLGENKVYAITGRLPTTPKTRKGEPTMEQAQARYWSICHTGEGPGEKYNQVVYGCLMDDEITVDGQNDYIIAYSRPKDRPANARPECGVTWQDFGPESRQAFPIRWMSVYPDHFMEEHAPNEKNIPWETGAWSQDTYDQSLVGENRPGIMGPYHPVIHYLTKTEFEALGCPIDPAVVPEWR